MKKYIYLAVSTMLLLTAVFLSGSMLTGQPLSAELFELEARSVNNTITASGRLEYRAGTAVKLPHNGIIDSIAVSNGDSVQKDDLLLSYCKIDDAYLSMLSQYTGLQDSSALVGLLSQYGDTEELLNEVKQYCPIEQVYASRSGKVTELSYDSGDFVGKDSLVLRIAEQQQAEIPVNINETSIRQIQIGQPAEIVFTALPDRRYSGKVSRLAKEAAVTNGLSGKETTVEVVLTLDEQDEDLRVGYSASCSIITSVEEDVLIVPYDAIHTDRDGDYVWVNNNGFARKTAVVIGTEYKDGAAILQGLSEGDSVILNDEPIQEGQKIVPQDRKAVPYA